MAHHPLPVHLVGWDEPAAMGDPDAALLALLPSEVGPSLLACPHRLRDDGRKRPSVVDAECKNRTRDGLNVVCERVRNTTRHNSNDRHERLEKEKENTERMHCNSLLKWEYTTESRCKNNDTHPFIPGCEVCREK